MEAKEEPKERKKIKFYETGKDFDFFSNVAKVPIKLNLTISHGDKVTFDKTAYLDYSESGFQGLKGLLTDDPNSIKLGLKILNNEFEGKDIQLKGTTTRNELFAPPTKLTEDLTIKERIMLDLLLCKATNKENLDMTRALLDSDADIIEDTQLVYRGSTTETKKDALEFWGNGRDGDGRNALGRLWMEVRHILREELKKGQIQVRQGLSKETCNEINKALATKNIKIESETFNKEKISQHQIDNAAPNVKLAKDLGKVHSEASGVSDKTFLDKKHPVPINHLKNITTEWLKTFCDKNNLEQKSIDSSNKIKITTPSTITDEQAKIAITVKKERITAKFAPSNDNAVVAMVEVYLQSCSKEKLSNHIINSSNPDLKIRLEKELAIKLMTAGQETTKVNGKLVSEIVKEEPHKEEKLDTKLKA